MDLVQSVRKEGSRGGRGDFKWEDVRTDAQRENYLGHSLMAPVGRWQQGKDLNWYAKGDEDTTQSEADKRRDEIRKVKEAEEDAMAAALGLPPPSRNANMAPLGRGRDAPAAQEEPRTNREDAHRDRRRGEGHQEDRRHRRDDHREEDWHSERRKRRRSRSPERDRHGERRRHRTEPGRRSVSPPSQRTEGRMRYEDSGRHAERRRRRSPDERRSRSPTWRKRRREELDSDSQATSPTPPPPRYREQEERRRHERERSIYRRRRQSLQP